ncbi:MAG: ankyrin repeat domain-containing protein [Beijerinckiaceae bacterium]
MNETPSAGETPDLFSRFMAIDQACRDGDMDRLRAALGNTGEFPDTPLPPELEIGEHILHHAIHVGPLEFIRALLQAGAGVNYGEGDTPPLFAAILCERDDRIAIMQSLIDAGADVMQTGYNEWTPLHLAVNARDTEAIALLCERGADPYWRAGDSDADTSAFDDALAMEFDEGVEAMLNAGRSAE